MKNIAASTMNRNKIIYVSITRSKNVYKETIIDESIDFERFLNGRRNKQKEKKEKKCTIPRDSRKKIIIMIKSI